MHLAHLLSLLGFATFALSFPLERPARMAIMKPVAPFRGPPSPNSSSNKPPLSHPPSSPPPPQAVPTSSSSSSSSPSSSSPSTPKSVPATQKSDNNQHPQQQQQHPTIDRASIKNKVRSGAAATANRQKPQDVRVQRSAFQNGKNLKDAVKPGGVKMGLEGQMVGQGGEGKGKGQ